MSKKQQILMLSLSFIKKESFSHLSFEYLAEQLDVTKTAIHYYFKAKDDLGIYICDFLMKELKDQYKEYERKNNINPFIFFNHRLSVIGDNEVCPITSLQTEINEYSDTLKEKVLQLAKLEYDIYKRVISGKVGKEKGAYYTQVYVSLLKGSLFYQRTVCKKFKPTALAYLNENLSQ
ncbi:hypothetical protein ATX28_09185 [Oenococcus oeni]|uniref:TetR/AcrR family transcriptional regulator n=1 Tax=Oenococcus oeni TaxID=1247 RepID=UPI0009514FBC|nr:TetR/AcrR family transcriptional regulator [Oenococcus oeni]OLQ38378.1 hypothetical protein ATX28_09185 [Oenococcus oeni]